MITVRMGAWYGDRETLLEVPSRWHVDVIGPDTPPAIDDAQIAAALANPVAQAPLSRLARGKRRPLIVVDDLTRPTPTDLVIPHVLRELDAAGLRRGDVTIMVAAGAHGLPAPDAAAKKAGAEAAATCRLLVHDARSGGVRIGETSFGTPVIVDREVAASDLLIGIGGVYPQHSVGFGGGSKLVLGVLAQRSIVALHYGHPSVAGSYDINNDFRRDLDEMAELAGLRTVITVHIDVARRPVRVVAGDPVAFYEEAARLSRLWYGADPAGDRYDVVIANAYPMDVSLTFARSKGLAPFAYASRDASRVLVAACPEGLGLHRLFPYLNGPRFENHIHRLRRLSVIKPTTIPRRALHKMRSAAQKVTSNAQASAPAAPRQQFAGALSSTARGRVHFWAPLAPSGSLPDEIPGLRRASSWAQIVERVEAEHPDQGSLRVAYYPCSPLQCLTAEAGRPAVGAQTW